jgi:Cys-rich repeat protein
MAIGLTGLAAVSLAGCNQESNYCDANGCYSCDGLGCHLINPPTRSQCSCAAACQAGSACTSIGCTTTCTADTQCPMGTLCRAMATGATVRYCLGPQEPLPTATDCTCRMNSDCTHLGPTFICSSMGMCITGCHTDTECTNPTMPVCLNGQCSGRLPPVGCTATSCPSGDVCLDGSCVPLINTCRFNTECNGGTASSGRTCVNQQCTTACTAGSCPTGSMCGTDGYCHEVIPPSTGCVTNTDCTGANQVCVSGRCFAGCTTDAECGAGNYCDAGTCRLDTRPMPGCGNGAACASGAVCHNGACRSPCTMDSDCPRFDVQTNFCIQMVCATTAEATANCTTQSDCHTAGQACVNGTCH